MDPNTSVAKVQKLINKYIISNEKARVQCFTGSYDYIKVEIWSIRNHTSYQDELVISSSVIEVITPTMLDEMIKTFVARFREQV